MAIIIPHQLPLAPPTCPPSRFQRTASQSTAVRFFVSISPLFCFQQSSLPSPSVCFLVPFVPLLRFFRSALSFPLFRSFVPFGRLLHFLQFIYSFPSVRFYELLLRSQLLSLLVLSPLLSVIFASLKFDTRLSTLETMPFNVRDHALLAPRTRPSTLKNTPFFLCLRMCLISCQLQVLFHFMPSSLRRDFRVRSC